MKKENTSDRLKQLMSELQLRQVDILERTLPLCAKYGIKMNKSDISQYVSGKVEPNQDKLFVLSLALNVSEGWLMGYDVAKSRHSFTSRLSDKEQELLAAYRSLNAEGRDKLLSYADDLVSSGKYIKNDSDRLVEEAQMNDNNSIMSLGEIVCNTELASQANRDILDIKARHWLKAECELKWTKISPSNEPVYTEVIDYFFNNPQLYFRGYVARGKNELSFNTDNEYNYWYYKNKKV